MPDPHIWRQVSFPKKHPGKADFPLVWVVKHPSACLYGVVWVFLHPDPIKYGRFWVTPL